MRRVAVLCALVGLAHVAPAIAQTDPTAGELVIFVNSGASEVDRSFQADHLPKIRAVAAELGAALRVIDVRDGAPAEVTITPLVVYQNWRGRSIYVGRYTTHDRIRNFVRTSRSVPQGADPLVRRDLPIVRLERAAIGAPLKVAAVTGDPPRDYAAAAFAAEALQAVTGAFERFKPQAEITLRRGDRLFYMDFNPWCAKDGTLYVSTALYSQFHCKQPVHTSGDKPFVGPWKDRARLFADAARSLEAAVATQLARTDMGDGFDPVPAAVPLVTWESLGLALPARPLSAAGTAECDKPLPQRWQVVPAGADDPPQVQFRFAPPLDAYAGEVRTVRGEFALGAAQAIAGAAAKFEAEMKSLTMGEPDLDAALQGEAFLETGRHPRARFTLREFQTSAPRVAIGQTLEGVMVGELELKGQRVPLSVRTILEPTLGADGGAELVLDGSFELNIVPFKLEGPDGPAPAKETMQFEVHVRLRPE